MVLITVQLNGDDDLPVCVEFDDDTWNENFLDSLVEPEDANENRSDEEGDEDLQPPPPTLMKSLNHWRTS